MVKEYGYEYDAVLNDIVWKETQGKVTYEKLWGAMCLRSGRDALKTIAREFPATKVFVPALACDSMILPFEMYEHEIVYYRLNEDYSIDLEYLETIIADGIFFYMEYFGNKTITDNILAEMRKNYNLIFVEDRTHNLIWQRNNTFEPEFTIASLRKWINVPDGGLLWCNKELNNKEFLCDTSFAEIRLKAQCMRNDYFQTGKESIKSEYREIFSSVSSIIDRDNKPSRMSAYTFEIVKKTDWNEIRTIRKNNAEVLIKILREEGIQLIQDKRGYSDLYVPFLVDNRNRKQHKLSAKGIFNTVIWPLNDKQKLACKVSKYTEEHMLAAPCDQRYTVYDMKLIGNEICRVIRGENNE